MRAPARFAARTISAGVIVSAGACAAGSRSACDVTQFWQFPQ